MVTWRAEGKARTGTGAREATGGHRLVTWRPEGYSLGQARGGHGRPREAMGGHRLVTWRAEQTPALGQVREATGGHSAGNLEGWKYRCTGTGPGGHGRQWETFFDEVGNLEADGRPREAKNVTELGRKTLLSYGGHGRPQNTLELGLNGP